MSKLAVTIMSAVLCAGSMLSLQAEAMTSTAPAEIRRVIDAIHPIAKAACGWYPSSYPQSWAVYTPGWGCRYVYYPYDYDRRLYRRYYRIYDRPPGYRGWLYLRPGEWW